MVLPGATGSGSDPPEDSAPDAPVDFPRDDAGVLTPPPVWQPRPKFQDRLWLHVGLFGLTVITTTLVGADHYAGYLSDFVSRDPSMPIRDYAGRPVPVAHGGKPIHEILA